MCKNNKFKNFYKWNLKKKNILIKSKKILKNDQNL